MTLIFCRKRKIIDFILFIMIKLEIYNLIILGQIRKEDIMIVREDRKHMEIDLSPCIDPNVFEKIKIIYVVKLETSISSIPVSYTHLNRQLSVHAFFIRKANQFNENKGHEQGREEIKGAVLV